MIRLIQRYWSPDEPAPEPAPAEKAAAEPSGNMIPEQVWDDFMAGKGGNDDPEDDGIEDDEPRIEPIEEKPGPTENPEKEEEKKADPVDDILASLNETLGELNKKLDTQKPEPEKRESATEPEIEPAIQALLEHDDENVREGAKALLAKQQKSEERIAAIEATITARDIEAHAAVVQKEIDAVQAQYGLTDEQIDKVATYLEADPMLASVLSFEEGVHRIFPDAKPRSKAPTDDDPSRKNGQTVRVKSQPREKGAAVIDRPANAGVTPTPTRAPDGESMEQAVDRGWNKLFGG